MKLASLGDESDENGVCWKQESPDGDTLSVSGKPR